MASNEVRKDYLLNRWVTIAKERNKRPTDLSKKIIIEKEEKCPLCSGNEHMTPPAVLAYLSVNGELKKEKDHNGIHHKNWLVRVVPNLYPIFSPPNKENATISESHFLINAIGHHEVIVESACHGEHPGIARVSQLVLMLNAYIDLLSVLSKKSYVKYVAIFKNHGSEAGASLSHTHSQLITCSIVPTLIEEEVKASKDYWNKNHECLLCNIMKKEVDSPRFIWENNSFAVFAPWASLNPFEFWVFPKCHHSNMSKMSNIEVNDLAETMRLCLGGLRSLLNNPAYNYGFHTVLSKDAKDCYHWHLEIYPKLLKWAVFEKSTGIFTNTISPEDAATELRVAVKNEKKTLK